MTGDHLLAKPVYLKEANQFIKDRHRHSIPTVGCRFALGCVLGGSLVGVAVCGRPVARGADDGKTLEILRVCTDGTKNACSFLYSRCRRIAIEMGYTSLITYTLRSESGASLRAVGAVVEAELSRDEGGWNNRPNRKRQKVVGEDKYRWQLLKAD